MNDRELLNQALVEVDAARSSGADWFNVSCGICGNVGELIYRWEDQGKITCDEGDYAEVLLENLICNWPECNTETSCYPVGGPDEYTLEMDSGSLWDNPRRIELLNWLIEETK